MQSSNPIFTRSAGFNGRSNARSDAAYPGSGSYDAYGSPASWGTGTPGYAGPGGPTTLDQGRMTIDSVVQKTGLTVGIVALVAAALWVLTPDVSFDPTAAGRIYGFAMIGALVGFVLSMVNSFKRVISPALVIAYAVCEGLFIGGFSKILEAQFGGGIVMGAVVGTIAAVAGTLAAYKFFDIRVGQKFRTWVIAAVFGFVALSFLDLVLGLFHADLGVNQIGGMGLLFSVAGLALGVLMLILDFDFVERGIAAGLPERESWRAAFGLTVTIVWIYVQVLRILASLRNN